MKHLISITAILLALHSDAVTLIKVPWYGTNGLVITARTNAAWPSDTVEWPGWQGWRAVETNLNILATNNTLSTPLWNDVRIPLASTRNAAASPDPATFLGNTRAYQFAGNSGADESLEFELQLPHGIDTNNAYGTRLHIHWTSATATTGVVWGIEWTAANPGAAFSTSVTNTSSPGTNSTAYGHAIASIVTITNVKESAVIVGRLFRQRSDASTDSVFGVSLDAHIPLIRIGSSAEMGDY